MPNLEQTKYFIEKYCDFNEENKKKRIQNLNEAFDPSIIIDQEFLNFDGHSSKILSYEDYFNERKEEYVFMLFIDVDDFSTYYNKLPNKDITNYLDGYYKLIIPLITYFGGVVEKTIGDGIICLFGSPFLNEDREIQLRNALWSAQAIIKETKDTHYSSKIAIHSGFISYYKNGSKDYTEFTAIGDTITELFRLESVSKKGAINFYCDSDCDKYFKEKIYQRKVQAFSGQKIKKATWFKGEESQVILKGVDNYNHISHIIYNNRF